MWPPTCCSVGTVTTPMRISMSNLTPTRVYCCYITDPLPIKSVLRSRIVFPTVSFSCMFVHSPPLPPRVVLNLDWRLPFPSNATVNQRLGSSLSGKPGAIISYEESPMGYHGITSLIVTHRMRLTQSENAK